MTLYLCVITYQYDDRIVEIPSNPTSKAHAEWLVIENGRLNFGSEHVIGGRVYSQDDYAVHLRLVA
jgi:hypothetical protein